MSLNKSFYKYLVALYYSYTVPVVNSYWQPVVNSKIAIDNRLSIAIAFLIMNQYNKIISCYNHNYMYLI